MPKKERKSPEWIVQTDGILEGYRHTDKKNVRAVVFVHGFTGNADTWRASKHSLSFLELLAHDASLPDFDVFQFLYRSEVLDAPSIKNIAKTLKNELNQLSQYHFVIVAHSLGGLVAMRYILGELAGGDRPRVSGLILYGTPARGTDLVKIGKLFGIALDLAVPGIGKIAGSFFNKRNRQLAEIGTASHFLDELHSRWGKHIVNGGDSDIDPQERMWLPIRIITGNQDDVISESSAKGIYGEIDWHPVNAGHIALVKPKSRTDERYKAAQSFLKHNRQVSRRADILPRLQKISDSVWHLHRDKYIHDWHYGVTVCSTQNNSKSKLLKGSGYADFEVSECRYKTSLTRNSLRIGLAYGRIAASRAWQRDPDYVHAIIPKGVHGQKLKELETNFRKVLSLGACRS